MLEGIRVVEMGLWVAGPAVAGPVGIAAPARALGPVPMLGAHTEEALREAGLGDIEIAELRNAGAIADAEPHES
jgi:crotonobetainyl-CoA:carnitine CoA-transferase CaiB-like acyl-CoA transferase